MFQIGDLVRFVTSEDTLSDGTATLRGEVVKVHQWGVIVAVDDGEGGWSRSVAECDLELVEN